MVTEGQEYVEQGIDAYEKPRLNRKFAHLDRQAQKLGFQLLPKTQGEEKQNPMPSIAQASVTQEERDRSLRLSVGVKDLPDASIHFRPVGVAAAVLPVVGDDHELKQTFPSSLSDFGVGFRLWVIWLSSVGGMIEFG